MQTYYLAHFAQLSLLVFPLRLRSFISFLYLKVQDQMTISVGLKMFQNMYGAQWQLMMAVATLAMIPTVVLFFLTQRTFIEGIALTGIKG